MRRECLQYNRRRANWPVTATVHRGNRRELMIPGDNGKRTKDMTKLVKKGKAKAAGDSADRVHLKVDPRYYPLEHFRPDIDLTGKLAVVTGASRGNGLAI